MKSTLTIGNYDVSCETKGEIALVSVARGGQPLLEAEVLCTYLAVPIVFSDGDRQVKMLVAGNGKSAVWNGSGVVPVGKGSHEFMTLAHRAFGQKWKKETLFRVAQVFYDLVQACVLSYLVAKVLQPEYSWTTFGFAFVVVGVLNSAVTVMKNRGAVRSLRRSLNVDVRGS